MEHMERSSVIMSSEAGRGRSTHFASHFSGLLLNSHRRRIKSARLPDFDKQRPSHKSLSSGTVLPLLHLKKVRKAKHTSRETCLHGDDISGTLTGLQESSRQNEGLHIPRNELIGRQSHHGDDGGHGSGNDSDGDLCTAIRGLVRQGIQARSD